ncbi:MAG: acetylxylan esterase [Chthoniobacterales bacterium]
MDDASISEHDFRFDPSHGYDLAALLKVEAPSAPDDFEEFWRDRYARAVEVKPRVRLKDTGEDRDGWRVWEVVYSSTKRTEIRGWALIPLKEAPRRGFVVGHGYGGRDWPDFHLPMKDAAYLFPCSRGLGKSRHPRVSGDAAWHVLHNIHDRDRYVIGGCVDDVWIGVSALERISPGVVGHVGYLGISFGGGIGAMAVPWDDRIKRAHYCVPTFGNQPLRAKLGSVGSAASVQAFLKRHPEAMSTLGYYDAAISAKFTKQPVHCACALFDPAVAPAGQFAVHNSLAGVRELFVLKAGHFEYPEQSEENERLLREIDDFFRDL